MKKYYFVFLILFIVHAFTFAVPAKDLSQIKQDGVLRHLGVYYARFVTGSGDGFSVDLVKGFAKEIDVEYKFVKSDFSDIIADLSGIDPETGEQRDVKGDIIETGFTVLNHRKEFVDFSHSVFPTQVWLVTSSENSLSPITPEETIAEDIKKVKDLIKGYSVLGIKKTCLDPALYDLKKTGAKPVFFNGSVNDLAPAVINDKADATLLDVADTLIALEKWPGKIKVIGPVGPVQDMAAAFRKDSPDLKKAYNDYLEKICKNGEYQKIVKKYYPMVFNYYPEFFGNCRKK